MLIDRRLKKLFPHIRLLIVMACCCIVPLTIADEVSLSGLDGKNYEFPEERSAWQAIDWLMYMQDCAAKENYQGRFVFSRGSMSSAMSIIHQYERGYERERLKQLDGEMGEIIREGERVMCVFPENRVVEVESNPFSNNFTQKFVGFMPGKSHYSIAVKGRERMIERPCVVLEISANDKDRYSYKLWIDEEKGLLLKSELLDVQDEALERFQYTQISYPEKIDSDVFNVVDDGQAIKHEMIKTEVKDMAWSESLMWQINWLPKGYERINGKAREGENIMVYSDGLSAFSVFIESAGKDAMPEGATQVGATTAYSTDLSIKDHDYHVTVVGEVPVMTAMKVAKSVRPIM
jgi:sigma-E factor negative regulatory protein RseB